MSEMPQALAYERVKIDSLKFDPRNARKHDDRNIKAIMDSLSKFGQQKAIVVGDGGVVIAGNGTLEAAKRLGWDTIDVRRSGLKADEATAYAIADNRSAELAEWDDPVLGDILGELKESGWELDDLGFNDEDLKDILKQEALPGLTDEDEVPEVDQNEFGVKRGDIWKLGNHRIMCGDSALKENIYKLMDHNFADLTFTSPPYNANSKAGDGDIFTSKKSKKLYGEGYHDNRESSDYVNFAQKILENCFLVTKGFIFWNVSYNANSRCEYIKQIIPFLNNLIEQICWRKTSSIPFKGSMMRDWEPIYVFSTEGLTLGLENVTSNHWQISNQNSQQENHKACFPVALPEKGISLIRKKTGIVFEPFTGSGSTLIACEKTGRKCYGMELDEHYCSVIIKRWQDFTGKVAERIVEGA